MLSRKMKLLAIVIICVAMVLGMTKVSRAELSKANIGMLQKEAEQGDAKAQFTLGGAYHYGGYGVDKDDKQAASWWRKAAEQGNSDGQYNLATAYHLGAGVEKDDKQAAMWLQKAADQGNKQAFAQLIKLNLKKINAAN